MCLLRSSVLPSFLPSLSRFCLQRVDITSRAVLDIMTKTTEYLQPNPGDQNHKVFADKPARAHRNSCVCLTSGPPRCLCPVATRAKMSMMNSMSRMRGQEKGPGYTQTEAILGESMQKFGRELGEESSFGELEQTSKRLLLCFTRTRQDHVIRSRALSSIFKKVPAVCCSSERGG